MKYRTKAQLIAQAKFDKLMNKIKYTEAIDFNNKRVSIKMDDYSKRIKNNELSNSFVEWLEENKDNEFIAVKSTNSSVPNMYDLVLDGEKVEPWTFSWFDLKTL